MAAKEVAPRGEGEDVPAWFVGSVEKAFRVLHAFEARERSLGLTEIAEATGLDKSAVQRFTYTLAALGYLRRDADARRYTLSPKILGLAMIFLRTDPLVARARHHLYELNKAIDETVNMTELDGTDVIYVVRYPGRRIVTVDVVLGTRRPAYCTAAGRAMLATMGDAEVEAVLQRSTLAAYTQHTLTTPEAILAEVRAARTNGFAVTVQETVLGDISIAAPVRRADGRATAAVNIAVSATEWNRDDVVRRLAPMILQVARAVSETSEFRPMANPG